MRRPEEGAIVEPTGNPREANSVPRRTTVAAVPNAVDHFSSDFRIKNMNRGDTLSGGVCPREVIKITLKVAKRSGEFGILHVFEILKYKG